MHHVPNDIDYYARREQQCLEFAEKAADPQIRRLHLQFAESYALARRDIRADRAFQTHMIAD